MCKSDNGQRPAARLGVDPCRRAAAVSTSSCSTGRWSGSTSIGGRPSSKASGAMGGACTSTASLGPSEKSSELPSSVATGANGWSSTLWPSSTAAGANRLRGGCTRALARGAMIRADGRSSGKDLVRAARLRVPNCPATQAANLAPLRRHARRLHVVGRTARWADDEHGTNQGARFSTSILLANPLTEWKPCRLALAHRAMTARRLSANRHCGQVVEMRFGLRTICWDVRTRNLTSKNHTRS